MSLIDLECKYSTNVTNDCSKINKNKQTLMLGNYHCNNYLVNLFFEMPTYPYIINLYQAKLVLFKIPLEYKIESKYLNEQKSIYSVYPLLNFFSIYHCDFSSPQINPEFKTNFYNNPLESFLEIDITNIISAWVHDEIENKGLLLAGNRYSETVRFASANYEINGMRPILRLIYDGIVLNPSLAEVESALSIN